MPHNKGDNLTSSLNPASIPSNILRRLGSVLLQVKVLARLGGMSNQNYLISYASSSELSAENFLQLAVLKVLNLNLITQKTKEHALYPLLSNLALAPKLILNGYPDFYLFEYQQGSSLADLLLTEAKPPQDMQIHQEANPKLLPHLTNVPQERASELPRVHINQGLFRAVGEQMLLMHKVTPPDLTCELARVSPLKGAFKLLEEVAAGAQRKDLRSFNSSIQSLSFNSKGPLESLHLNGWENDASSRAALKESLTEIRASGPAIAQYLLRRLRELRQKLETWPSTLSLVHHDLNPNNIIVKEGYQTYHGTNLRKCVTFIDFEYAGWGDLFYDLVSFKSLAGPELWVELLHAYAPTLFRNLTEQQISAKLLSYQELQRLVDAAWYLYMLVRTEQGFNSKLTQEENPNAVAGPLSSYVTGFLDSYQALM